MKKIALMLALALVIGICAFAVACEPAPADNSSEPAAQSSEPAPVESSEEAPAESPAESAEEPSEDAPAESAEPSEDTPEESPAESAEAPSEPEIGEKLKVPKNLDTFFVAAYNVTELGEGQGNVFTTTDIASSWSHHVAFAPVEGNEGFFEVVEVSYCNGGTSQILAVPEGGFVYTIDEGNNWPELMKDKKGDGASGAWYDDMDHLNKPNMNTVLAQNAFAFAGACQVGEIYYFENLDLETFELPTTTPEKGYWEDDYVCTAKYGLVK